MGLDSTNLMVYIFNLNILGLMAWLLSLYAYINHSIKMFYEC